MSQRPPSAGPSGFLFSSTLAAALIASGLLFDLTAGSDPVAPRAGAQLDRDLAREGWSSEVRDVAAWSINSHDHAGQPFVIIDQTRSRLFAFTGKGLLAGSTRILYGGQHDGPLPAGRYTADTWRSARAGTIVWADAHGVQSLQAVPAVTRPEPIVPTVLAQGAGDASVQVAGEFYRQHLRAFRSQDSVLYVLPELLPLQRSFTRYASAPCRRADRINQPRTLS